MAVAASTTGKQLGRRPGSSAQQSIGNRGKFAARLAAEQVSERAAISLIAATP